MLLQREFPHLHPLSPSIPAETLLLGGKSPLVQTDSESHSLLPQAHVARRARPFGRGHGHRRVHRAVVIMPDKVQEVEAWMNGERQRPNTRR